MSLKSHEFDALVSFHFNTGAIARASITRHLNAGNKKKAAASFMNWTRAGGLVGALKGRRVAERAMFERGDYGNVSRVLVYDKHPGPARSVSTASLMGAPAPKSKTADAPELKPKSRGLVPVILAILAALLAFVSKKIGAW